MSDLNQMVRELAADGKLPADQREFVDNMLTKVRHQEQFGESFYAAYTPAQVTRIKAVYQTQQRVADGTYERANMENREKLDELLDCTILSTWESEFVDSIDKQMRNGRVLSQKQEDVLKRVYQTRVVDGEDGTDD